MAQPQSKRPASQQGAASRRAAPPQPEAPVAENDNTEFDAFEALTKRLLAVPKDAVKTAPTDGNAQCSA